MCDMREGCKLNTFFHFVWSFWQIPPGECVVVGHGMAEPHALVRAQQAMGGGARQHKGLQGLCKARGPTVASSIGKLPQAGKSEGVCCLFYLCFPLQVHLK